MRVCIFSTHAGAFWMQRSNFLGLFVSTRGSESAMADKYVSRMNQGLARAYISLDDSGAGTAITILAPTAERRRFADVRASVM